MYYVESRDVIVGKLLGRSGLLALDIFDILQNHK